MAKAPPGSIIFVYNQPFSGPFGMEHNCPCGCGNISYCGLTPPSPPGRSHWQFNEDIVNPTLSPSLQMGFPCKWHGYLENGEWRQV